MTDCDESRLLNDGEYLASFRSRTRAQRVPLSGGINLTNRCNLKCVHCYIRDCAREQAELPTERILKIIDESAAAGCLFFLLTGGEPLLHSDFKTIYRHARRLGMLVSVFTNGTLIDETHIQLFRKLPPHHLEITLYGATEETFTAVTGAKNAFLDCHRGIRLLREGGIRFSLKTMLMTLNAHELESMRSFARELDVKFRMDPMISPRLDGDLHPLKYRVDPELAAAAEMADDETARRRMEYDSKLGPDGRRDYLYKCGSGMTGFFVSATGRLQPCMMVTDPSYDIANTPFIDAWHMLATVRDAPCDPDMPCRECEDLQYCGYCPPVMELESGSRIDPDSFICRLGRSRRTQVRDLAKNF